MAGKVRTVRNAPPAAIVGHGSVGRFVSQPGQQAGPAQMAAALAPMPDTLPDPDSDEANAKRIAQLEGSMGLHREPESVPPVVQVYSGISPLVTKLIEPQRVQASEPPADLSSLPDRFTLEVERKGGVWVVRAPGVHQALFVADGDLVEALAAAPGRLAEIVAVDGIVPAKGRKK